MSITRNINLKQFLDTEKLQYISLVLVFFCMPIGISLTTIFAVLAFLIWMFSGKIIEYFRLSWKPTWMWPVIFLILIAWVGLLYSPDPSVTGFKYARKTHYWMYCLVISSVALDRSSVGGIFNAFLWGLGINAVFGVLQAAGIAPLVEADFTGFGVGYRKLSAYLTIGILFLSYRFGGSSEKKEKFQCAALAALFFVHLILLKSRTGYFTFIVLSPVIIHFAFRKIGVLKNSLICLMLLCMMLISPVVRERVALTGEQLQYHLTADPSEAWGKAYTVHQNRFYFWHGAVGIFLEHPLIGVGTGGYSVVLKEKARPDWPVVKHPHNDILYMAASYGIVGIFLYFWLVIEIIKNAWPNRFTPTGNFIYSTMLVFIVSGLTNGQILDAGMLILLSLTAGLQSGLPRFKAGVQL